MSIIFQLISFLLIFLSVESVGGSTHAVVGDYSQLNGKDCGYSKMTSEMDSQCFEWHKNPSPSIKRGRNATYDDVPWLVYIKIEKTVGNETIIGWCSGSFINNQWILTAAHCLSEQNVNSVYNIIFGSDLITDQRYEMINNLTLRGIAAYPHPGFFQFPLTPVLFDIGLIKLETPVDALDHPLFKRIRSICLPERDVFNENVEYAMTAGWGKLDPLKEPAQLGYKQILVLDPYLFMTQSLIYASRLDDQGLICGGDSGGPLWQYSMGRAVIIGVTRGIFAGIGCEDYNVYMIPGYPYGLNLSVSLFTRVSHHIDWISSVTQLY